MKLLDKLKNALFEEEYVEVEEKPKKKAVPKESVAIRKELPKDLEEEKPIAKKIVLPERKEVKITNHENIIDDTEEFQEEVKKEHKFPMISDNEFTPVVEEKIFEEPKLDYVQEVKKEPKEFHHVMQHQAKENKKEEKHPKLYGIESIPIPEPEYGTYEKKEEKPYFKPSPIISPIYGIIDENYKKEEIVPRREVRISSSYSRENLDLDKIRNKAYGTLSNDIENVINDSEEVEEESNFMDQDLLDLTNEHAMPEIKKVTISDAEEYFTDLGLEYNIDYKDSAKEKASGRRCQETNDDDCTTDVEKEEEFAPVIDVKEYEEKTARKDTNSDDLDDDNLFDLIDSMYEKE